MTSELYKNFKSIIKKLSLYDSLRYIGKLSNKMFREMHDTTLEVKGVRISVWELAFIVKELLKNTTSFNRPQVLNNDILLKLHDLYYKMNEYSYESYNVNGKTRFTRALLQVYSQQITMQGPLLRLIPRTIGIYYDSARLIKSNQDLLKIFSRQKSLSILDYLGLGMFSIASMRESCELSHDILKENAVKQFNDIMTNEKINGYFSICSTTGKEFRRISIKNDANHDIDITYRFNFLRTFPLIEYEPQKYFCPIPLLLTHKLTIGLYYDFINIFKSMGNSQPRFYQSVW